jgi:hypothetical protein
VGSDWISIAFVSVVSATGRAVVVLWRAVSPMFDVLHFLYFLIWLAAYILCRVLHFNKIPDPKYNKHLFLIYDGYPIYKQS